MADPYWGLSILTASQRKELLTTILTHPMYGAVAAESLFQPRQGKMPQALDVGYADALLRTWDEATITSKAAQALTAIERGKPSLPGVNLMAPGASGASAVYRDIFRKSGISEDTFDRWETARKPVNFAMDTGAAVGELRAQGDPLLGRRALATYQTPVPVSPEGEPAVGEGGINLAEELTKGLAGYKPEPKEPFVGTDPIEAYQDLLRRQAGISDQLDMLLDDPKGNQFKIEKLMAEATSVDNRIQRILPYVFQKGEAAERMALNREELEFRREQERNVGARHAAGLGESAASRAQAAAQFAERQAFEREKERTDLVKFQEQLEQQLRQLTMQAAQLNVPLGFQFQGPNGPVTPPTTQISLPAQAPNLQAVLAAAGA